MVARPSTGFYPRLSGLEQWRDPRLMRLEEKRFLVLLPKGCALDEA